jgi:hypothetical protein
MATNLGQVLRELDEGRVCPQPEHWQAVWELLADRQHASGNWVPSPPLILAAWWETTDAEKRARFEPHLQWAAEHGALEAVAEYLNTLKPGDWHTASGHG